MQRFRKWLFATLLVLLGLLLALYFAWSWTPAFYLPASRLLASDPEIRQLAKQTDQQALQFLDELRHESSFTLRLTDRQLNAWLAGELEPRHPHLLPPLVARPRLRFQPDECLVAARFQPPRGPATIANARLQLSVTADHRLGIELVRLQAGWFPLPPEPLLEPLLEQLRQAGAPAEWRQIDGHDILAIDVLETPWIRERIDQGQPRLERITISDGVLELAGRRIP